MTAQAPQEVLVTPGTSPVPPTPAGTETIDETVEATPTAHIDRPAPLVLRVAYVKDHNAWLWTDPGPGKALTTSGDVVDSGCQITAVCSFT